MNKTHESASDKRIKEVFLRIRGERSAIMGIGNILRGDDAFGPRLIERIKDRIGSLCIDAGAAPENYLGRIAKERPEIIMFADAVHMDKPAGRYAVLDEEEMLDSGMTTHDISPVMLVQHLRSMTDADIFMLAVQPGTLEFNADMSDKVKKALESIVNKLTERKNAADE